MAGNMKLFEVLNYGPIVASNEDCGLLVTVNGAYLNMWVQRGPDDYENTDCRSFSDIELGTLTWIKAAELAEAYIQDVLKEDN